MQALARGQTSDCANPLLVLQTRSGMAAVDPVSLSFQIWDCSTGFVPTLVYPSSGRQAVDLADCPDGDRLDIGSFVARWTVPALANVGTYELRYFYVPTVGALERVATSNFVVQALYATVEEMRDEGITEATIGDSALQARLELCSALIEEWTGRWFYPRRLILTLDGTGGDILPIGPPIISVAYVRSVYYDADADVQTLDIETYAASSIRVYNRHLTQHLLDPDDRNNPKLQSSSRYGRFPSGSQNIEVAGLFGYTDPDGSPTGRTPRLINHVCKLLAVREVARIANSDARDEAANRGRVSSLRTRDQTITWNATKAGVGWTGDAAIDNIIAYFRRPPVIGAA